MRRLKLPGLNLLFAACLLALAVAFAPAFPAAAQSDNAYITVTYIEPINVRAGPSSFDYPVVGQLPVGGTARATGVSPKGEWIQIAFDAGPHGFGWVYAANVQLTNGSNLPIVPPPATPAPQETATLNPTFEAALQPQPTNTRKPTFTAPPPIQIPTYVTGAQNQPGGIQIGWIIAGLGVVGLLGVLISAGKRR